MSMIVRDARGKEIVGPPHAHTTAHGSGVRAIDGRVGPQPAAGEQVHSSLTVA